MNYYIASVIDSPGSKFVFFQSLHCQNVVTNELQYGVYGSSDLVSHRYTRKAEQPRELTSELARLVLVARVRKVTILTLEPVNQPRLMPVLPQRR